MKGVFVLSAVLLLAGASHAQSGYSASSIQPIVLNVAPITSYSTITRGCNCSVISARNEGTFFPSTFEGYDQVLQEGQLALKAGPLSVAEAARLNRAQKKAATQTAVLVAVQDDRGRLVYTDVRQ